jgi:WD40 repeat protein
MLLLLALSGCQYGKLPALEAPCPDPSCQRAAVGFGHDGEVRNVVFSPSGRYLASASKWGEIRLWRTDTAEEMGAIPARGHCRYPLALAFAPDDGTLFTLTPEREWEGGGGRIAEWYFDGALRREIRLPRAPWCRACFSADTSRVAFQSTDWTTYVIDLATARVVLAVPGVARSYAVALSPDGNLLATASRGMISVWNTGSCALVASFDPREGPYSDPPTIDGLAFSPDGTTLAVGVCSRGLALFRIDGGAGTRIPFVDACPTAIAFSPDGARIAAGNGGGISVFNATSGAVETSAQGLCRRACLRWATLGFSPDGRTLASGVLDTNSVSFWDSRSGRVLPLPSCSAR